jgi:hypothetical protein
MKTKKWSVWFRRLKQSKGGYAYIGSIQIAQVSWSRSYGYYVTKGLGGSTSRARRLKVFNTWAAAKLDIEEWAAEKFGGFSDKQGTAAFRIGAMRDRGTGTKKADVFVGKIKVGFIEQRKNRRRYCKSIPFRIAIGLGEQHSIEELTEFPDYEKAKWFVRKNIERDFPKFFEEPLIKF